MTLLRESFIYRLWLILLATYMDSDLHRALAAVGGWCNRQIDESRVLRPICREGVVAKAWPESFACRLLTFLINLPGWLLHKLYACLHLTFEDSFFARLAFRMSDESAVAQSWLIMLLWVIPFSHWNNAYSLMGFAMLLALFYVRTMHREDQRLDLANFGCYTVLFYFGVALAFIGVSSFIISKGVYYYEE